ncbi:hypothetical protein LXL04_028920 [Taraxacum kok-saghyz]
MGSSNTTSPPPSAAKPQHNSNSSPVIDVALRAFLFATSLVAIIVLVTSKQTKLIPVAPGVAIPLSAKLNYVPSFIYLLAALVVACLYSIGSGMLSFLALLKPARNATKMQLYFVMLDALLLGILASATGAAMGVSYIGLKGNSHTGWQKICNTYDSFCLRSAASILLTLTSSITLLLLIWVSVHVLYKKVTRK